MGKNKIEEIKKTIDVVKDKMVDNIDKILLNGEKMETLVESTNDMVDMGEQFHRSSNELKWKFRMRLIIAITAAIAILTIILIIIVCILAGTLNK